MTTLHRIALLGFSDFERSTLASYFRLASTREPRYEQVPMLTQADFIVADADHPPSVEIVVASDRLPETVFLGTRAPEGAIAWLGRPIDPLRVLRELDVMAGRRMSQPVAARGQGMADTTRRRTVIQPVRPRRPDPPAELLLPAGETLDLALPDLVSISAPSPTDAAASMPATAGKAAAPRAPASASAGTSPLPATALLVDDSEVALRFLQKKLAPFALVTECVLHSEAAIRALAQRRYDFVFLDMELGERSRLDGLGLCQHIKRDTPAANVVMVTAHHTELDRVRGALAGCDGFLGKPLDEEELALYLARFGVKAAANAGGVPS